LEQEREAGAGWPRSQVSLGHYRTANHRQDSLQGTFVLMFVVLLIFGFSFFIFSFFFLHCRLGCCVAASFACYRAVLVWLQAVVVVVV
jgi:hypothetical protein